MVTPSLRHHFPSSTLPIVPTSLRHRCHVKSHATLHQGQVSMWCIVMSCKVSHHPSSRSSLNRAPPFKVKSQSRTTLQGQVSIAHHPSSFQVSEFYLSVTRKYCFPTSFDYSVFYMGCINNQIQLPMKGKVNVRYHSPAGPRSPGRQEVVDPNKL